MSELSNNIILVILVTSLATYLSRFLGVISSEKIDIKSRINLLNTLKLLSDSGTTLLTVTHHIESVLKNTKRIIIIEFRVTEK